jgi:hypothetical protein
MYKNNAPVHILLEYNRNPSCVKKHMREMAVEKKSAQVVPNNVTEREFVNSLNGHFNCFYRMTMAAMAMKPKYIMAHLHPSRGSIKLSTPVEK